MLAEKLKRFQAKDIEWTERHLSHTPFYSGFWVNHRLRGAISSHCHRAHGVLLDLGCGMKPYEKLFAGHVDRYIGVEYSKASGYRGNAADVYGDALAIPLASKSVDTILCTEVLEHVRDPDMVIMEMARVLKPGGVIICTAPFFYPVHDSFDFFRYSPDGVATLMRKHGLTVEKVIPLSGSGITLAILFNLYWFEIGFMWTKWLYPIGLILRPVLLLFAFFINILGWILDKIVPATQMSFNHLTLATQSLQSDDAQARETVLAGNVKSSGCNVVSV